MAAPMKGVYWSADAGFPLNSVNPTLFTHVYCAFATLNANNTITAPPGAEQFTTVLRPKNSSVKTLLSIGGAAAGGGGFATMAAHPASRATFINSSIQVARQNSFDGLDLDYEFPPTQPDMDNLALLLDEWRQAIDKDFADTDRPRLLLTAAVHYSNNISYNNAVYPATAITNFLDWINVMSYDLWGPVWANPLVTGPAAALYPYGNIKSGSEGITDWINARVPIEKIVFGIPFYGRAWTLTNREVNVYGAPTTGAANIAPDEGAMTYRQIRDFIATNRATTVYDPPTRSNYCYAGNTWISYDDVGAVREKVQFVRERRLLGYFAWHVGGDDDASTLATTAFRT